MMTGGDRFRAAPASPYIEPIDTFRPKIWKLMLCIFCSEERSPSLEHVFRLAIGGTITMNRVCRECNSTLGRRVDAALSDFLPIRIRRAKLGLAGNGEADPILYESVVPKRPHLISISWNPYPMTCGSRVRQSLETKLARLPLSPLLLCRGSARCGPVADTSRLIAEDLR